LSRKQEPKKQPKARSLYRMSPEELAQFVQDYVEGRIFSTAQMTQGEIEHHLSVVFLPVFLGLGITKQAHQKVGLIWARHGEDPAGPWSVNGMPTFLSCRVMHKDDWEVARQAINREIEARKTRVEAMAKDMKKVGVKKTPARRKK
jgi:hypothetical protein